MALNHQDGSVVYRKIAKSANEILENLPPCKAHFSQIGDHFPQKRANLISPTEMNKFLKYLDCLLSETNLKINLPIVKKKKKKRKGL